MPWKSQYYFSRSAGGDSGGGGGGGGGGRAGGGGGPVRMSRRLNPGLGGGSAGSGGGGTSAGGERGGAGSTPGNVGASSMQWHRKLCLDGQQLDVCSPLCTVRPLPFWAWHRCHPLQSYPLFGRL